MKHVSRRGRWRTAAVLVAGLLGSTVLVAPAHAAGETVPADFNGDGYRDAVLRVPAATVGGKEGAGAVIVLYGSASGLSAASRAFITQDSPGVPGAPERGDAFGSSTASADLDRDGYADLIVGAPYEDLPEGVDKGLVSILWGSGSGLRTGRALPSPDWIDRYGRDVAASGRESSANSLLTVGGWNYSLTYPGPFSRSAEPAAYMGMGMWLGSLATGDHNGDDRADHVAFSGRVGPSGGMVFVDPDDSTSDALTEGDGLVGAIGDVNGDGYGDLVVGDPDEPERRGVDGELGGRVLIWYGSAQGIGTHDEPVVISQDSPGVPGAGEKNDRFGASVAVSDLDGDGVGDIVVGSPGEALGSVAGAGMITVVPGTRSGTPGGGAVTHHQETAAVPGGSEPGDNFGTTVSAGDVNDDGHPELIVSAKGENDSAGAAWVLPGGTNGPTGTGSKMLTTSQFGLPASGYRLLGGDDLPLL
ncbi:hypothetical protein GCM10010297_38130 [Streptomyces malachitofuscus]|nr:hypothetical protein GCM10010297_38130 [Streptomyces malachitofuscus]